MTRLVAVADEVDQFGPHLFKDDYASYLCTHLYQLSNLLHRKKTFDEKTRHFVVFQINALRTHPYANEQHCLALMPYLAMADPKIFAAAFVTVTALSKTPITSRSVKATLEWLDGDRAIVQFEHPKLGMVEREFCQEKLPNDTEPGDEFKIEIQCDQDQRVTGYAIQRDSLVKRAPSDWEKIPEPLPPRDINNREEMERYRIALDNYSVVTTKLRAQEAARWRATHH